MNSKKTKTKKNIFVLLSLIPLLEHNPNYGLAFTMMTPKTLQMTGIGSMVTHTVLVMPCGKPQIIQEQRMASSVPICIRMACGGTTVVMIIQESFGVKVRA